MARVPHPLLSKKPVSMIFLVETLVEQAYSPHIVAAVQKSGENHPISSQGRLE